VAAVRGVTSGTLDQFVSPFEQRQYEDPLLSRLQSQLAESRQRLGEVIQFAKQKPSSFVDLSARRLVDGAIMLIVGHLLLGQAVQNQRKQRVARRFIQSQLSVLKMNCEQILSGDTTPVEEYDLLAGPVPSSNA
jgi:hypothetical protein